MTTRRRFLSATPALAAPVAASSALAAPPPPEGVQERISLDGTWQFRLTPAAPWRDVTVPHTWQVEPGATGHYGRAFYRRAFLAPQRWSGCAVRVEFEAVFHSARVSLNGKPVGEHLRKGYTAFTLDLTPRLSFGALNTLDVEVDNAFDMAMLPRGRSSDWAHDGGITRPVTLLVTPPVFVEFVAIDADPDLATGRSPVRTTIWLHNSSAKPAAGAVAVEIFDQDTGLLAADRDDAIPYSLQPNETRTLNLGAAVVRDAQLWHFDHPHLYRLRLTLDSGHIHEETFGIRKIEVRGARFFLNGKPIRPMGVERMAGSHPELGMAESSAWIAHDHRDMQELNCVYTRTHWPQDHRVLNFCDRNGILLQTEVPAWGPNTFKDMTGEPDAAILQNGLDQLREMIARDRNHPCIFSWGVCNEVNGQNPVARQFIRALYAEAKRLDPSRLVTYASHSLFTNPGRDAAGEMDYVMFNEYYGSWQKGWTPELERNLDELHAAFPDKPIVISEYGYCACTEDRPENDPRRIEVLESQDGVFRARPWIAGLIFFCYNDYRTHVGDKGLAALQQRVHGVVDLYGNRKPSFDRLRRESSPIESLTFASGAATLVTRAAVPSYTLNGYTLRAVAFGPGAIPLEALEILLPALEPGSKHSAPVAFKTKVIERVELDVLRPRRTYGSTSVAKSITQLKR